MSCGLWWRADLGWVRANALVGAWLIECIAWTSDGAALVADPEAKRRVLMAARQQRGMRGDDLARAEGYSRQHFTGRFASAHGTTPGRWLMETRLEEASRLLRTSDRTVREIADQVGFVSASSFGRVVLDFPGGETWRLGDAQGAIGCCHAQVWFGTGCRGLGAVQPQQVGDQVVALGSGEGRAARRVTMAGAEHHDSRDPRLSQDSYLACRLPIFPCCEGGDGCRCFRGGGTRSARRKD